MPADLLQTFLSAVDGRLRPAFTALPDLDQRLARLVQAGAEVAAEVRVAPEIFVTYVAARLPGDRDPVAAFEAIRAADLFLACACAHGDPAALAVFDARYFDEVEVALRRMRLSPQGIQEIKQLVRHKLFVGDDNRGPRIGDYSGRGDLRRWVRSTAVRTSLNQMRKGRREVLVGDDQVLAGMSAGGDDPELAYMKERYQSEFREAFRHALGALTERQQAILRYHFVDGLTIDDIGAIYRVHRVTAYRWIDKARERLVTATMKRLRAELRVDQPDLDSIMRLIRSQLHLSLQRFLGPREDD